MGFPIGTSGKEPVCQYTGDVGSVPGSGRSPGEEHCNPLSIPAWKIPRTGEPGRLQSVASESDMTEETSVSSVTGRVQLFATPQTAARQASLSITNSQSLHKLMSIWSVMSSHHLIFCDPPILLPSIFPSIRVFSIESALRIRWPKYWSFSINISPSMNIQD